MQFLDVHVRAYRSCRHCVGNCVHWIHYEQRKHASACNLTEISQYQQAYTYTVDYI